MKTRTRFHLLFLELATIARFVAITFAVVSPMCFKEPIRLAGFITNCVGAALLAICFILFFPSKFRNNIPPYVYLFLIGISELCAIAEVTLYGFAGFKKSEFVGKEAVHNDLVNATEVIVGGSASPKKSEIAGHQDEVYVAAMVYVIASLVFSVVLFVALIAWPPIYEASEKQDVENRYSSRRGRSSKKQENSVSLKKQKSQGSNRSRRDNSRKSDHSRRGDSRRSDRSRRKLGI